MKIYKYVPTQVGRDPKNPLVDLHPDDYADLLHRIIASFSVIERAGQEKSDVWTWLIARSPKHLIKGQHGPNNIITVLLGIIKNHVINAQQYNQNTMRFSKKQLDSLEQVFLVIHAIDPAHDAIQFQIGLQVGGVIQK